MAVANFVISVALFAVLFAAIYKLLPDKPIEWRDVAVGAVATAILFTIGKSLIGLYIGHSKIASGYGAAGALVVMLVWIYSAEIFLFGAEFTRAYAQLHGSHAKQAKPETAMQAGAGEAGSAEPVREAEPKPAASEAELSPERLELRAGMARHEMSDTWQVIRARMPRSPALGPADAPDPVDERPSWFQIAVAAVAFAALPKIRPRREPRCGGPRDAAAANRPSPDRPAGHDAGGNPPSTHGHRGTAFGPEVMTFGRRSRVDRSAARH